MVKRLKAIEGRLRCRSLCYHFYRRGPRIDHDQCIAGKSLGMCPWRTCYFHGESHIGSLPTRWQVRRETVEAVAVQVLESPVAGSNHRRLDKPRSDKVRVRPVLEEEHFQEFLRQGI